MPGEHGQALRKQRGLAADDHGGVDLAHLAFAPEEGVQGVEPLLFRRLLIVFELEEPAALAADVAGVGDVVLGDPHLPRPLLDTRESVLEFGRSRQDGVQPGQALPAFLAQRAPGRGRGWLAEELDL